MGNVKPPADDAKLLKLNLGCGENHLPGYVNVDKYGHPDVCHDLEVFPWPWQMNSVSEIVMNHVLEHLGESSKTYLNIIRELYRICTHGALLNIAVPHPRHDDFITDPTHVRAITPRGMEMFSKKKNREWIQGGYANSPLGLYLNVDFEIVNSTFYLDSVWANRLNKKACHEKDVYSAMNQFLNVVKEIRMVLKAVKA
jgi:hypothetical protein